MTKRSRQGAIYAVKVGGDAGGSVRQIFAKALAEALKEHAGMTLVKAGSGGRGVITADELRAVVGFMIDELDMGASAQALGADGHRYNEMVRGAAHSGIPMIARARGMLRDAWRAHDKEKGSGSGGSALNVATLRGKVRGMAQLLAYVTAPYSWDEYDTDERNTMIRDLENEARAEMKVGL